MKFTLDIKIKFKYNAMVISQVKEKIIFFLDDLFSTTLNHLTRHFNLLPH